MTIVPQGPSSPQIKPAEAFAAVCQAHRDVAAVIDELDRALLVDAVPSPQQLAVIQRRLCRVGASLSSLIDLVGTQARQAVELDDPHQHQGPQQS